jgi:hypothetical protein
MLADLREKGLKLIIITNGCAALVLQSSKCDIWPERHLVSVGMKGWPGRPSLLRVPACLAA